MGLRRCRPTACGHWRPLVCRQPNAPSNVKLSIYRCRMSSCYPPPPPNLRSYTAQSVVLILAVQAALLAIKQNLAWLNSQAKYRIFFNKLYLRIDTLGYSLIQQRGNVIPSLAVYMAMRVFVFTKLMLYMWFLYSRFHCFNICNYTTLCFPFNCVSGKLYCVTDVYPLQYC